MPKKKFCVVVPAYNEEKVIESSLRALKTTIKSDYIYVVSDGSKDKTVRLANRAGVNVLALRKNIGKARALEKLIKVRKLRDEFKYILFSDADSRLDKNFFKSIKVALKRKPACIVSTVSSHRRGIISAFRTYEYGLSHLVYKNAQNTLGTITVAPGCASLYRHDILNKLDFSGNTLTEDYDLTLQIHEKRLGEIIYVPKAKVITQDPMYIKDYWNQVVRWNTGFWQNLFLHKLYLPTKKINFEIYLSLLDSLVGIGALIYLAYHPEFLIKFIITIFAMTMIISVIILNFQRQFWAILYAPLFPFIYFINLFAYIYSFFRMFSPKKHLLWNRAARYKL